MTSNPTRCLILACGNTLRSDDGVGPWLCAWAAEHFASEPGIRIISRQQWTPDLAEDIASADSVLFIDCSVASEPGSIEVREVTPAPPQGGLATHHTDAAHLLALAQELYSTSPTRALLLTVGAGSTGLGEEFSPAVRGSLPQARESIQNIVQRLLAEN